MSQKIIKGHKVVRGKAEGEALVTKDRISFFGGVNPETGFVTDKTHELNGVNLKDKILVFPEEKGSSGGSYQIYELAYCNNAPKGIINIKAGSIVAVGAIISEIPMMDQLESNPLEEIKTGDWVELDADDGTVTVHPAG